MTIDEEIQKLDEEIKRLEISLENEGITHFWIRVNGEEALTPDQRQRFKTYSDLRALRLVKQVERDAKNNPNIKIKRID